MIIGAHYRDRELLLGRRNPSNRIITNNHLDPRTHIRRSNVYAIHVRNYRRHYYYYNVRFIFYVCTYIIPL